MIWKPKTNNKIMDYGESRQKISIRIHPPSRSKKHKH